MFNADQPSTDVASYTGKITRRSAFTLVELLVVIAILAILMTLLLPFVNRAMDRGKQIKCASNMRQVGVSAFMFAADHGGKLPALSGRNQVNHPTSQNPNGYDAVVEIQLHAQGKGNIGHPSDWFPPNSSGAKKLKEWLCPADLRSKLENPDMRAVSYAPSMYAWNNAATRQVGSNYTSSIREVMINPANIATRNGESLSEVIMMGELSGVQAWIIGQPDPLNRPGPDAEGNYDLQWFMRVSHNAKRGMNRLFFDGHVTFDEDYYQNYATDLKSLMWGFFRYD